MLDRERSRFVLCICAYMARIWATYPQSKVGATRHVPDLLVHAEFRGMRGHKENRHRDKDLPETRNREPAIPLSREIPPDLSFPANEVKQCCASYGFLLTQTLLGLHG